MRSFVMDGNFTADHIRQVRPNDDVWLTDGEGMMTAREPYAAHIKRAKETQEVSHCSIMENANQKILLEKRSVRTFGKQLSGDSGCKHGIWSQRCHWHRRTCMRAPRGVLSLKLC
jgi:hypothetical protein